MKERLHCGFSLVNPLKVLRGIDLRKLAEMRKKFFWKLQVGSFIERRLCEGFIWVHFEVLFGRMVPGDSVLIPFNGFGRFMLF